MAGIVAGVIFGGKAVITHLTHKTSFPTTRAPAPAPSASPSRAARARRRIGKTLATKGVVKSAAAFEKAAAADPDRAGKIQPGDYLMREHMSGAAAFNLLFDPKALDAQRFTIAEGLDLRQHPADHLQGDGPVSWPTCTAAAQQPKLLGLPSWASGVTIGRGLPLPGDVRPASTARAP